MSVIPPDKTSAIFKIEKSEIDPAVLDRAADALLQMGHRRQAEWLAHCAAELREGGHDHRPVSACP